jgi:choline dehydrogenase-like flavoprotein
MAGFDYDVLVIGSGFGGSVAALRATEKGYRVGVMESGRRWKDEDIPKTQWDLPGVGRIPIGDSRDSGAVDPYLRLFGQPDLHVMDGSVMPANPGVNPSLMITALAERAMSLWPNKGDVDTRPPLGSGYERINPVMPQRPVVPAGAPGELRLDAATSDIIPEFPY